jgi:hypothetical protein|tara:strand:- start:319 stop:543 length:225 start_codon:yes stop_codon:yes gene_type:complete
MSNVIHINPPQASANEILEICKDQYADLLVLGWDEDENLSARASSALDTKELLYIVELFKIAILNANVEGLEYD